MQSCELPAMPGGVTVRDGGSDVASADVATTGSEKGCCWSMNARAGLPPRSSPCARCGDMLAAEDNLEASCISWERYGEPLVERMSAAAGSIAVNTSGGVEELLAPAADIPLVALGMHRDEGITDVLGRTANKGKCCCCCCCDMVRKGPGCTLLINGTAAAPAAEEGSEIDECACNVEGQRDSDGLGTPPSWLWKVRGRLSRACGAVAVADARPLPGGQSRPCAAAADDKNSG